MPFDPRLKLLLIAMLPGWVLIMSLFLYAPRLAPEPRVWVLVGAGAFLALQLLVLAYLFEAFRRYDSRAWGQVAAWIQGLLNSEKLPVPVAPRAVQKSLIELDQTVRAQNDRLGTLAIIDPKTGALSRQGLLRRLRDEAARAHRFNRQLAVVVLAYPAPSPTRVIEALSKYARSVDLVALVQPTSHAILLPETSGSGAMELAKRIHADLSERFDLEIGIGLAIYSADGRIAEQLLKQAEHAALSALSSPDDPIRGVH